jgi:PKD repeat protein
MRTAHYAFVSALALSLGCTVHGTDTPALTGPSEAALSVGVTVSPDTVVQDGKSQAVVTVTAFDVNGQVKSGQSFRLDTEVATGAFWERHELGSLSLRTLTTGSDGKATAAYTPPSVAAYTGLESRVRFVVTPIGSNYAAANERSSELRLVPPGGYQADGPRPKAAFSFSPAAPLVSLPVFFNASSSCAEDPSPATFCTSDLGIARYDWEFGDGAAESSAAPTTAHAFAAVGKYKVTLTVTNGRRVWASVSNEVDVKPALPTAAFTISPSSAVSSALIVFNAGESTAVAGRYIAQYIWDFGDGIRETNSVGTTQHVYPAQATGSTTYTVLLTVVEDAGQRASKTGSITINAPTP